MSKEELYFGFEDRDRTFAWLQKERNPDLWHHILYGMNYDSPSALDYIQWIVSQPDCDVATAAAALIHCQCWHYVYQSPDEHAYADARQLLIASEVCHRSENAGYSRARIGWHPPYGGPSPASVLEKIHAGCAERGLAGGKTLLPVPATILGANFDKPPAPVEYFIDEGGFSHLSTMDPFMQKIMGFKSH